MRRSAPSRAGAAGMPIESHIDVPRRLVQTKCSGVVRFDEVKNHQDRLLSDPDFDPTFDQIINLLDMTSLEVSPDEAMTLAQRKLFSRTSRRALVAASDMQFGIARMLQTYNELGKVGSNDHVFRDIGLCPNMAGPDWREIAHLTKPRRERP